MVHWPRSRRRRESFSGVDAARTGKSVEREGSRPSPLVGGMRRDGFQQLNDAESALERLKGTLAFAVNNLNLRLWFVGGTSVRFLIVCPNSAGPGRPASTYRVPPELIIMFRL